MAVTSTNPGSWESISTSNTSEYFYADPYVKRKMKATVTTIRLNVYLFKGLAVITDHKRDNLVFHKTTYGAMNPDPELGDQVNIAVNEIRDVNLNGNPEGHVQNVDFLVTHSLAKVWLAQNKFWSYDDLEYIKKECADEHDNGVESVQGCTRYSTNEVKDDD